MFNGIDPQALAAQGGFTLLATVVLCDVIKRLLNFDDHYRDRVMPAIALVVAVFVSICATAVTGEGLNRSALLGAVVGGITIYVYRYTTFLDFLSLGPAAPPAPDPEVPRTAESSGA